MPETTFTYRAQSDFSAVERSIRDTERKLERLNAQALRTGAAGRDVTKTNAQIQEERNILASLKRQQRNLQRTERASRQTASSTESTSRVNSRIARLTNSVQRSLERSDRQARSQLQRSASLARNLRDAGPLGLASAGITTVRGVSAGVLEGVGLGAGAATALGTGVAVAAGVAALPVIIGTLGDNATIAFEDVEALRSSLEALGRTQGFVPAQQISDLGTALRGTISEADALRYSSS